MADSPRSIGALAELACRWEVLARKAGNVCPGREFPDLTVDDFLKSAAAIAPVLDQAPHQPLGVTILRSIEATRKVVNTNTNLGIVLLLAPLTSVPLEESLMPGLAQILAHTTVEDSRNVYAAIRLAKPGGLGKANEQDVCDEPTLPLQDVMALAMDRDLIAAQYSTGFNSVMFYAQYLETCTRGYLNIERAIVRTQHVILTLVQDSLVWRKCGRKEADRVMWAAGAIRSNEDLETSAGQQAYRRFDAWLRSDDHVRNPGTTADLIAAALFVALRERMISPDTPFTWNEHPFEIGA